MKICAACSQELPREKFSKKQWQLKKCRRCKKCIAENREVRSEGTAPNDAVVSSAGDGEEAPHHTDEVLFKQPSPREECPICMLPLPLNEKEMSYFECCGKTLCGGCTYSIETGDDSITCPFCRTPAPKSDGEAIERLKKRVEANDAEAMYNLGCYSNTGRYGLQRNRRKAMKLWLRAGELGHAEGCNNIGHAFEMGEGMERDAEKAKYYYEVAAMRGYALARYNLGIFEERAGNMSRAVKHYMISAAAGYDTSLKEIRECYLSGHATKDDFEKALRAHKEAKDEMKSDQREAAAAARGQI